MPSRRSPTGAALPPGQLPWYLDPDCTSPHAPGGWDAGFRPRPRLRPQRFHGSPGAMAAFCTVVAVGGVLTAEPTLLALTAFVAIPYAAARSVHVARTAWRRHAVQRMIRRALANHPEPQLHAHALAEPESSLEAAPPLPSQPAQPTMASPVPRPARAALRAQQRRLNPGHVDAATITDDLGRAWTAFHAATDTGPVAVLTLQRAVGGRGTAPTPATLTRAFTAFPGLDPPRQAIVLDLVSARHRCYDRAGTHLATRTTIAVEQLTQRPLVSFLRTPSQLRQPGAPSPAVRAL